MDKKTAPAMQEKLPLRERISLFSNRKIVVRGTKYHLGETLASYTLLLPTIITLIILFVVPLVMLVALSFFDYRIIRPSEFPFYGLNNFVYLFTSEKFWLSLRNTFVFAVVKLGLDLFLALAVALMLDSRVWFRKLMRTIYFSPVVTPVVACSLIWLWFYDPGVGPFNQILGWFGIEPLKWLYAENTAMLSIIVFSVWHGLGYNVVLLLSGLQGVSGEYLEAAKLDGASEWTIIRKIKLPLLKPIISFVMSMGIINAFKAFSEVNVMTPEGGPGYSTALIVNYIYEQAFTNGRMGRGAAASIILFVLIFVLTQIKNRIGGSKELDG